MSNAADRNRDNAPLGKKLEDLYGLIDGIEIAMFTTRAAKTGTWSPAPWPRRLRPKARISGL